jgi:predicted TIM-barrel fold metal-dependent hydrolase
MLIDIHGHIGQTTPGTQPPPRVTTYAGVCGIHHVLVSNRDAAARPAGAGDWNETDANAACLDACQTHRYLLPLYWVRPGRVDSNVQAFAGAMDTAPFLGAVFAPTANGFDAADPQLKPYLAILTLKGRPALFCVGPDANSAPARIYEQARRYPNLPVVLCGCGATPAQRAEAIDVARHSQQRKDADLYLDTSHADIKEVRSAVLAIGSDRVLFGTNAVTQGDAHVPRTIALLDELRQNLPGEAFRQITGENAARLFGIAERGEAPEA